MSPIPMAVEGPRRAAPFEVKDCALMSIATGRQAYNLRELREHLLAVEAASLYTHFWAGRLRHGFNSHGYINDFAIWALQGLDDLTLAERLAIINPSEFAGIEDLRQELIDVVEQRLDEQEYIRWARENEPFVFIRSQVVVFDTGIEVRRPRDMAQALARFSRGSVFYHVIDARRRRQDHCDDFCGWLEAHGDPFPELTEALHRIDPYFLTLEELRDQLAQLFLRYGGEIGL